MSRGQRTSGPAPAHRRRCRDVYVVSQRSEFHSTRAHLAYIQSSIRVLKRELREVTDPTVYMTLRDCLDEYARELSSLRRAMRVPVSAVLIVNLNEEPDEYALARDRDTWEIVNKLVGGECHESSNK